MLKVIILSLLLAGCAHGSTNYWAGVSQQVGNEMRR